MTTVIPKAWGKEVIFADTEHYCGKLLCFDTEGAKFSMHFHDKKIETWYVLKGSFKVTSINTASSEQTDCILGVSDTWHNDRLLPHQLTALEDDSVIIEVSTKDSASDNYRILPGDSQLKG